jgi:hypothetical protein
MTTHNLLDIASQVCIIHYMATNQREEVQSDTSVLHGTRANVQVPRRQTTVRSTTVRSDWR